ncbi:MAG: SufD family Fe-S cluster assembly protein [Bacilli bacterium]|nr:SufD family Fe-S cluster assembly protein [Bacilli bacterium]
MILKDYQEIKGTELKLDEKFVVNANANFSLFLDGINSDSNLNFELKENSTLLLSVIQETNLENTKITANLQQNSTIIVYFADFSVKNCKPQILINLNGEGAKADFHLASLAASNDNKNLDVSIMHNAKNTYGKVDNYGVCKDKAKLCFAGTSHIINGAVKSSTYQNAKIMVFDPNSDAIAKPILKIDENDVVASHSAAVGKISDEHLFYLTSRGISLDEARNLITYGYLKPILKGFNDKEKTRLTNLIEGRL